MADTVLGPELRRSSDAVQQRFEEDTMRAMLRSQESLAEAASVPRERQAVLAVVSRAVHTLKQGQHADRHEVMLERLVQRRALGHRRGLSR
jgi:hypothetical protein